MYFFLMLQIIPFLISMAQLQDTAGLLQSPAPTLVCNSIEQFFMVSHILSSELL